MGADEFQIENLIRFGAPVVLLLIQRDGQVLNFSGQLELMVLLHRAHRFYRNLLEIPLHLDDAPTVLI